MPRMDQATNQDRLVKMLIIGDGKIGKTYYAGMAAAAGLNVLYIDGDVGAATLTQLPKEAKERIYMMDFGDRMIGGENDSRFLDTMVDFTTSGVFRWNDKLQRVATKKDTDCEIWEISPAKMDETCLLVIDSWTSLTESIMQAVARAEGVDLSTATTSEMRPVYGGGGTKAVQILKMIRSARCHVIVIGHPDEFQHKTAPEGRKVRDVKEVDMVIDWTKMIPKSTSRPQALQMAKYFTDVAWMESNPSGSKRMLNFRLDPSRVSGGHFNDMKDAFVDYTFAKLIQQLGGTIDPTATVDHWLKITKVDATPVQTETKVLDGTKATSIQGVNSLFAKKS